MVDIVPGKRLWFRPEVILTAMGIENGIVHCSWEYKSETGELDLPEAIVKVSATEKERWKM